MQHERDLFSWHSSATAGQRFGEAAEFRNHSPSGLHSTWCLQHQHGACPSARRPLQHLHGACPSTRRSHLAMCEAILHSHTGLRVSTNFQRWQFPHRVAFPKKRGFSSSRLSRCSTTGAARPVRHNAGGVFLRHPPASSPPCPPSPFPSRHAGRRANQTTAHDETSRARRHGHTTALCQSTARLVQPVAAW